MGSTHGFHRTSNTYLTLVIDNAAEEVEDALSAFYKKVQDLHRTAEFDDDEIDGENGLAEEYSCPCSGGEEADAKEYLEVEDNEDAVLGTVIARALPSPQYDPMIDHYNYGVDNSVGYQMSLLFQVFCYSVALCYHLGNRALNTRSSDMFAVNFVCYIVAGSATFVYVKFLPFSSVFYFADADGNVKETNISAPIATRANLMGFLAFASYSVGDVVLFNWACFPNMACPAFVFINIALSLISIVTIINRVTWLWNASLTMASIAAVAIKGWELGDRALILGCTCKLVGDIIYDTRVIFDVIHPLAFSPSAMGIVGIGLGSLITFHGDLGPYE